MKSYKIGDYISEHDVFIHLIKGDIDVAWICNQMRCKGNRSCELNLPEDMKCKHTTDCEYSESIANEKRELYFRVTSVDDGRIKVEEVRHIPKNE